MLKEKGKKKKRKEKKKEKAPGGAANFIFKTNFRYEFPYRFTDVTHPKKGMPEISREKHTKPSRLAGEFPRIEVFSRLGELFLSFSRTLTSSASGEIHETDTRERPVTLSRPGQF